VAREAHNRPLRFIAFFERHRRSCGAALGLGGRDASASGYALAGFETVAGKAGGHIGRWFGQICLSLVAHAAGLAHVARRAQALGSGLGRENIVRVVTGNAVVIVLRFHYRFAAVHPFCQIIFNVAVALQTGFPVKCRTGGLVEFVGPWVLVIGLLSVAVCARHVGVGRGMKARFINKPRSGRPDLGVLLVTGRMGGQGSR